MTQVYKGTIPTEVMLSAGIEALENAIYENHGIMHGILVLPDMVRQVYNAMDRLRPSGSSP